MKIAATIAKRMTALREKRGLSLQAVADRAGLSKSHIWELEAGNAVNPTINSVVAISRAPAAPLIISPGFPANKSTFTQRQCVSRSKSTRRCAQRGFQMSSDILALAERVERLTGPDRETDSLIEIAMNPDECKLPWSGKAGHVSRLCHDQFWRDGHAPTYTTSLDAAIKLIPGHAGVGLSGPHEGGWLCTYEAGVWGKDDDRVKFCRTPALALCAAALRARAAQPDIGESNDIASAIRSQSEGEKA